MGIDPITDSALDSGDGCSDKVVKEALRMVRENYSLKFYKIKAQECAKGPAATLRGLVWHAVQRRGPFPRGRAAGEVRLAAAAQIKESLVIRNELQGFSGKDG